MYNLKESMSFLKITKNLNVSEECFNDIINIVEELLSEGYNLDDVVKRARDKGRISDLKDRELSKKALEVESSYDHPSMKQAKREMNNIPERSTDDLIYKLNQGCYYDKGHKDSPSNQEVVELAKNKSIRRNATKKIKEFASSLKKRGLK